MPAHYRVTISPRASIDLEEIHDYIATRSPTNAASALEGLVRAIDSLKLLPHRYPIYRGRRTPSEAVRRMPVPPFLVYYRTDDDKLEVDVITVRHGKRRQPRSFE